MLTRRDRQCAFVLLMVIIVITIAALSGTTAMYLAGAELASAGSGLKHEQSRALAWSGVQAAMAELADQRDKLLDGQAPALTKEWELYTDESGTRGVVRLGAIGATDDTAGASESAKLDLNTATADMLSKVPGIDPSLAAAIISARGSGRFGSVDDLLRVKGVTPEMLRGGEANGDAGDSSGPTRAAGLSDVLTVFSFDPNVQAGLGQNGSDHRGKLRLNLSAGWSEALGSAIDDRFGAGSGDSVKTLMGNGQKFSSLSDVIAAARTEGLQPNDWPGVLDAFSVTDDPFLMGRVDVNRATAAVLAAVPGISAEAAQQIVDARSKVDDESKKSPAWVAVQGILTPDQFQQAVDHLTTRSTQWRVRVEAGTLGRDDTGASERATEATLAERVVLEAVIDVSSERPRVAYLRDVTLLKTAQDLSSELAAADAGTPQPNPESESDAATAGNSGGTGATGPSGPSGDTTGIHADLDLSSGMDKGFGDLNLGGDLKLGTTAPTGPIQGDGAPTSADQVGPPAPPESGPTGGSAGQDRRLGRWTTGKGAGS